MKKLIITLSLVLNIILVFAQPPSGYYASANGKKDNALRLALQDIIDGHTVLTYTPGLWDLYQYSDMNDGKIWDMYSTCDWIYRNDQCGNYSSVCDCYNREHSIPQSWFNSATPMNTDAFHIYPTDGKVNAHRDNFPFGECASGTKIDSRELGKLGASTFSGYSGTVFEPDNQYKGDFARTYFYMATRYANVNFNLDSQNFGEKVFGSANNGLTDYAKNLFLKWHKQDPVSQKEIDRNNVIFVHQKNRNPFIDHPELADYIWGDSIGYIWNNGGVAAIDEIEFFKIKIYPNPVKDELFIDIPSFENLEYLKSVEILDITGKKILITHYSLLTTHYLILDTNLLPQGIYFVKILTDKGYFVEKIIKN